MATYWHTCWWCVTYRPVWTRGRICASVHCTTNQAFWMIRWWGLISISRYLLEFIVLQDLSIIALSGQGFLKRNPCSGRASSANYFLNTIFVSSHMYTGNPEETQVIIGSMNMGYDIAYIRHCQESNSQPVPSQVYVDSTRPQWRTIVQTVHMRCKFNCGVPNI